MAISSGHPDDEQLERWIEVERMALLGAQSRTERRRAFQSLKELIAQRSPRQVAFMEAQRFGSGGSR